MDLLTTLLGGITANWAPLAAISVVCWKARGWIFQVYDETREGTNIARQTVDAVDRLTAAHGSLGDRVTHVEARVDVLEALEERR